MNTIIISEDLPSGGARRLLESNYTYLKKRFNLISINHRKDTKKISNIFSYYLYIFNCLIRKNKQYEYALKHKPSAMLAYQSWVTKSPLKMYNLNIPIVYICHEPPREFYDEEYIQMFSLKEKIVNLIGLIIKKMDQYNIRNTKNLNIIANSKFSAEKIYKIYGLHSKVVYPGISLSGFYANNSFEKRLNQVISVGAINKLKNQRFLLECISKIERKIRPSLILVGNGGDTKYVVSLSKLAKKLDVNLEIKINISRNDLIKLYRNSKIFGYSSVNEPFGIVILEALAAGLPIVASNNGGFSEVLSDKNGYMVSDLNPELWASKMVNLLVNKELWKGISQYNYIYSRKFSDIQMNKKIYEILKLVIEKKYL